MRHRVAAGRAFATAFAVLALSTVTWSEPLPGRITIDNFAQVNTGYFRGAQPEGTDYEKLAAIGVKTVINLIGDDEFQASERAAVERHGMRFVHIPMTTRKAPTDQQIDAFFAVINDPVSGPVYVHCVGGRHRTGVMTAIYRMTRDGLSGAEAFREMKQFKYGPDFLHPEFKAFVHQYKPAVAAAGGS